MIVRVLATLPVLAVVAGAQVSPVLDAPVLVAETDVRFVRTLDLDGDGWMDAVSALRNTFTGESNNYHVVGFLNDHAGNLVRAWSIDIPIYFSHLNFYFDQHDAWEVGDLDGDGDDDFVVSTGFALHAFLSNGAAAPTQAAFESDPAHDFRAVALADFDGDGHLDVADTRGWSIIEIRHIDLVGGTLPLVSSLSSGTTQRGRLVAGEFTGDSTPDLFADSDRIIPVTNGQLGTPMLFGSVAPVADLRNDAGDLDGDGDLDLITFFKVPTAGDPHGYRILRRVSPSQFVAELVVNAGGPARILVDVDGDGDLDGVCCGGGGTPVPENTIQSVLRIALNDGTGHFAEAIEVPSLGSTAIGGVADLDHDGRVDCVAGRCVYYQRRPIQGPVVQTVGASGQSSRTIADIDDDGDPDFDTLPWSVQRNQGEGSIVLEGVVVPPAPPGLVYTGQGHVGDWDGDGDEDRLVLTVGSSGIAGLAMLENCGSGSFRSTGLVSGPAGLSLFPFFLDDGLAADVDGDHDLDLVLRSFTATIGGVCRTGWLRNDGPAGFVYQTSWSNFVATRIVDIDGDGVSDLFGSLGWSPGSMLLTVAFVRGLGNGTFAAPTYLSGSGTYTAVDTGDVDGDGTLDVLGIPNVSGGSVTQPRLLRNQGGGVFVSETLPVDLKANDGRISIARIADFDLDGRLDLLVGPLYQAPTASAFLLQRSDGLGWMPPLRQVIEGNSDTNQLVLTTTTDIDGDGDVDLVAGRRSYRNLRFEGAAAGTRRQWTGGNAGAEGIFPLVGAEGPFRVGEPVHILMRGLRPQARVYLVSDGSAMPMPIFPGSGIPRPDSDRRVLRFLSSGASSDAAGTGRAELAFVVPATLAGLTRTYTALVLDPAAHGGVAISNRMVITYGP